MFESVASRIERKELRGRVQTVRGFIDPEELGPTLLHEHELCDVRPPAWRDRPLGYEVASHQRFDRRVFVHTPAWLLAFA